MRSQLRTASVSNINSTTWTAGYSYDKTGNVTQQTVGGANTSFGYDGDLMTDKGANSLDWDADGRMISGLSRSLTYNWDSKLRSVTAGGNTVALRYDPDGNRILRTVNTTTSRKYIVDAAAELPTILLEIDPAIEDPNLAITKTYIYANSQIIAQHNGYFGDPMYFYLHDRLGSVREMIDASAAAVNTYTFEPFGQSFSTEVTQTITNPWQFTGQYFDAEFGQYFLRARQYDPAIYRFTVRDPISGHNQTPHSFHKYMYCLNNPINRIDPDGRLSLTMATTLLNDKLRRPLLGYKGKVTEALVAAGGMTSLEGMADLIGAAGWWHKRMGRNYGLFVEDLLWMFTEQGPGMKRVQGNLNLRFSDTGFQEKYRDNSNQVRHFIGCVGAGYYFGFLGGRAAVRYNEATGFYSDADIALGDMGVEFGNRMTTYMQTPWGPTIERLDLDDVDEWVTRNLGE